MVGIAGWLNGFKIERSVVQVLVTLNAHSTVRIRPSLSFYHSIKPKLRSI